MSRWMSNDEAFQSLLSMAPVEPGGMNLLPAFPAGYADPAQQYYDVATIPTSNFAMEAFAAGGDNDMGFGAIEPDTGYILESNLQALGITSNPSEYDGILDEHPAKRQRVAGPVRSSTPDISPPPSIILAAKGLTDTVCTLSIPNLALPSDSARLRASVSAILHPPTARGAVPPSPRAKTISLPDPGLKALKERRGPKEVTIEPLQPIERFEPYEDVSSMGEGPEKEAAKQRNNERSAQRTAASKKRNNVAAKRSRDRKDKKIAVRDERVAQKTAERDFWKAIAVGMGADEGAWEAFGERFRGEMVADRRSHWLEEEVGDDGDSGYAADDEDGGGKQKTGGGKKAAPKKAEPKKPPASKAGTRASPKKADEAAPKNKRKGAPKKAAIETAAQQVTKQAPKKRGAAKQK